MCPVSCQYIQQLLHFQVFSDGSQRVKGQSRCRLEEINKYILHNVFYFFWGGFPEILAYLLLTENIRFFLPKAGKVGNHQICLSLVWLQNVFMTIRKD